MALHERGGVTLAYTGMRFTPDQFKDGSFTPTTPQQGTPLEQFVERFSNLGALVIRNHIGQGQRAGLLQQISRVDYADNPVERVAQGADSEDYFFQGSLWRHAEPKHAEAPAPKHPQAATETFEYAAHASLGRSKVLGERAQPLLHTNRKKLHGEQGMWDIIHAPVWTVGRNTSTELSKQGFSYIACPAGLSIEERAVINGSLSRREFELIEDGNKIKLRTGVVLEVQKISKAKITLDDKAEYTKEANGLAVAFDGEPAPLGWVIHVASRDILPQPVTEDIIRIHTIAKGGFYELRPAQQKILQSGNLVNESGLGLFTQNQAFNAIYPIFAYIEKYGFDPRPLLDKSLVLAYTRLAQRLEEQPDLIDDLLTGILETEMVQHLQASQRHSTRSVLPIRFTNPFEVTQNNLKAIAHAFDIKDTAGNPIFHAFDDDAAIHPREGDLIDCKLNGFLLKPSFNSAKHVGAVLSTATLVAEQMILEQLIPAAIGKGSDLKDSALYRILKKVNNDAVATMHVEKIKELCSTMPQDPKGDPILGLQFDYCQELLAYIRYALRMQNLGNICAQFMVPGASTDEVLAKLRGHGEDESVKFYLGMLFNIGHVLQANPTTTSQPHSIHGMNAGLHAVINVVAPDLFAELDIKGELKHAVVPPVKKSLDRDRVSAAMIAKCPFLQRPVAPTASAPKPAGEEESAGGWLGAIYDGLSSLKQRMW
jgi:hypothetical protein